MKIRVPISGNLEVLTWAREHHCPWDARTTAYAAEHGHTVVLQWAWEHGCPEAPVEEPEDDESEDEE